MHIYLDPDLDMNTNLAMSSILALLKELFKEYHQQVSMEETELVSNGQIILPMLSFQSLPFHLKGNSLKNPYCNTRFIAYSKARVKTEEGVSISRPCLRFIWDHRTVDFEELMKSLPKPIKEGSFDFEGESTIATLFVALSAIRADRVRFFYNQVVCEGVNTHTLAAIYDFGPKEDPENILTAYFSIKVGK